MNVLLPIQHDTSNSNDNAEVATMRPDMSDEVINTPDLDEARVVYENWRTDCVCWRQMPV